MSAFFLVDSETPKIDSYRPQIDYLAPSVSQADTPGESLQRLNPVDAPTLPNPAVGGQFGSGKLNGFSTGFKSLFNRTQRFSGAVAKPPAVSNPVQGEVGMNNRQSKQYAGVLNQLVEYVPSQAAYVAAWVGNVAPNPNKKVPIS